MAHHELYHPAKRPAGATANRESGLLSKIFGPAIRHRGTDSNPRREVEHFKEGNEQFRHLTWEEEPILTGQPVGRRADTRAKVIVAIGTGMRLTEQQITVH